MLTREKAKLERTLGGIRDMTKVPSAIWVVDTKKEHIAVGEARKLGIPVVSILDTNCDPDEVDYPIPGNDDAIRSAALLTRVIADAVADGLMARAGVAGRREAGPSGADEPWPSGSASCWRRRRPRAARAESRERDPLPAGRRARTDAEPAPTRGAGRRRAGRGRPSSAAGAADAATAPAPRRSDRDRANDRGERRMANFTAADVKKLRDLTGAGMMDCKKALEESDGDLDKAVELLRIKGAKDVGKRAGRDTANGLVAAEGGAMVELNCETDFVAKSADFQALADKILRVAVDAAAG